MEAKLSKISFIKFQWGQNITLELKCLSIQWKTNSWNREMKKSRFFSPPRLKCKKATKLESMCYKNHIFDLDVSR